MTNLDSDRTRLLGGLERPFLRGGLLLAVAVAISALGGWTRRVRAADEARLPDVAFVNKEMSTLRNQLAEAQGQLALHKVQVDRFQTLMDYSTAYQIPADLAGAIYDIALSEGIDPALAFRLVKVESDFQREARSNMGARGYTQLMLATARLYQPGITEEKLVERETNLRLGFRFLKDLMRQYKGDLHLALLAYNRGPGRVNELLAAGEDPGNGYSQSVLRGYRPTRR